MKCSLLALLALALPASGHYVWQSVSGDLSSTSLTFSEKAGSPGKMFLLARLQDKLAVTFTSAADGAAPSQLPVAAERAGAAGGRLLAALPASYAAEAAALEAAADYGIFTEGGPAANLQYYTSAARVTAPNDWFAVQDLLGNAFEVTLRDPYMSAGSAGDVGLKAPAGSSSCRGRSGSREAQKWVALSEGMPGMERGGGLGTGGGTKETGA
ncbi:hypothetical protein TeGR_g11753, partial [Tetraparma gracilis]